MATPPQRGWDGGDERGQRRTALAQDAGHESWAAWVVTREADLGYEVCGRPTRSEKPCGRRAGANTKHLGVGACSTHGGNNPVGKNHPKYKDGSHAQGWRLRYPDGLAQHVDEARETGEVERLREIIAMVAGRISQKMQQLEQGENPQRPAEFRGVLEDTIAAVQQGDAQKVAGGLRELRAMSAAAEREQELWEDVDALAERVDRHTRSLWDILKEMRLLVELPVLQDGMHSMMDEIRTAVEQEVSDEAEQEEVLRRVAHAARTWASDWQAGMTGKLPRLGNGNRP